MNKNIIAFLLAAVLFANNITAQDTSQPVQFSFSVSRVNDSLAWLNVKAVIKKDVYLFSAKKQTADDVFFSSLQLDSSLSALSHPGDTLWESANRRLIAVQEGANAYAFADSAEIKLPLHVAADSSYVTGKFVWLGKAGDEFPSGEEKFRVLVKPVSKPVAANTGDLEGKTLGTLFWLCLGAGVLAIFTPCVFPLIPVTVSIFLKKSKTKQQGVRNAAWYSASIVLIYAIPTIILTKIFGEKILYLISIHPVTNMLFFVIFIVFGISLLGAFELTLPSKWANSSDEKASKGGFSGIFFMALTLVIVSFSCTGPIVGLLLGQTSQQGTTLAPIVGMFGFGLGLALPFTLFAFFPSLMQSLPKSGGWLNSVKVAFGFIELALALKFLSNVDLIYHWRLLDREIFLVIWIVLSFLLGLYLLGKLKFSHDSDLKHIGIPRLFFSIAVFSFGLYLLPGLWGAPLKGLSGLIPPSVTQDFNLDDLQYKIGKVPVSAEGPAGDAKPPQKLTDKLHVPFGLTAYFDLEEGLAAAKALSKPVMLDFTGHSCANCRKMEEKVWKHPDVLKRMKENFVLISLYVDESTELPENEKYYNDKKEYIDNVGLKNLDYEIKKFGINAQPLYMFLDLAGNPLSNVKYGYDADVEKFISHLDDVKQEFEKRK
ncbi:protein-disulfide reductase DsbD family protein [Foetidibacter luteolus]|uniref:protein-disulfide reductase DsbD family protein n=1 Tax=Foetidibacter luteolus TaxID=2608880 RepID=UPI00129B44DF|nr:cytochrome c biogenesis protein CcdA [Foetidibacter luteolus]